MPPLLITRTFGKAFLHHIGLQSKAVSWSRRTTPGSAWGKNASGKSTVHQYFASPIYGNAVVHSVKAAQTAVAELSK